MVAVLETKKMPVNGYDLGSITKDKSDENNLAIIKQKSSQIDIMIKEKIKKLQPDNIDNVNRNVSELNNDKFYDI